MAENLKKLDYQQIIKSTYDLDSNSTRTANISSLVPEPFDGFEFTYVTSGNGIGELETVVYKLGATTVATLTLAYNASDQLISVVRS